MKKILLIGKFNQIMDDIQNCLMDKFQVQLCSESAELVQGMLKIVKPDMIIVCSIEINDIDMEVFELFTPNSYSNIPVLVIGTKAGCEKFETYYEKKQYEYLIRPVSRNTLLNKCCEMLNIQEKKPEFGMYDLTGILDEVHEKKSILIVDDSAISLRSIKAMLDTRYNVKVANSGEKALEIIKKKRPDLILLDYEMPGWDGKTVLEKIRNDQELQDIPVIFLTSVSDKKHITAVLRLNPAGYFLKPLKKEKVLEAIKNVLNEK